MWISDKWKDFELLDCSGGEKLERWGKYNLVRPDPQAIWETPKSDSRWSCRDARYRRSETGGGSWDKRGLPESWQISYGELRFNVKPMNFKHTGLFPGAGVQLGLGDGKDTHGGQTRERTEPLCIHRRCDGRLRKGGSDSVPCRRRKGHGCMGKGKRRLVGT